MAHASFGNAVFEAVPPGTEHLENLMEHPIIVDIAEKHKISTGQVLLAWAVSHQVVVISKSINQRSNDLEANARFNNFYVGNWVLDFPLYD
ncbi:hypothetical protein MUCCIDRAFT_105366 [Mucor lusitanicus CBS 277.49]|uniref:NADP-dependent oxidoreductase domain-containing protein n=1 Tax=Mucor lusitanicus CBS 277.49 TaxID=747725 RepID=A0A162RSD0_MUCCL|nr:hypothetical protein MUCCIDRAFT_105366 [Mucor lusitanicus CBS 277.49]